MIKITNSQLAAFNSEVINDLMKSKDRRFPTADAFRLADFMGQIKVKLEIYQESAKKLIQESGATLNNDGGVKFITPDQKEKVDKELFMLNSVEVELTGDHLEMTDRWPDLNIQEAIILRPLLNVCKKD